MPELAGYYPKDSRTLGWVSSFRATGKYGSGLSSELIKEEIDRASWTLSKTLVDRNLYLFGITDFKIWEQGPSSYMISSSLLVGDFKYGFLSIDEGEYWENKYHDRIYFELSTYANDSPLVSYLGTTTNKLTDLNAKMYSTPPPTFPLATENLEPAKESRKWTIINRGKV